MEHFALQPKRAKGTGKLRRTGLVGGVILGTIAAGLATAHAVDLRNRDRADREVTINHSDGRSEIRVLKAGETVADICANCVILSGNSSVEVSGTMTVRIERGEVLIDGKR